MQHASKAGYFLLFRGAFTLKLKGNVYETPSPLLQMGSTSPSRLAAVRVSHSFIQKRGGAKKPFVLQLFTEHGSYLSLAASC